MNKLRLDLKTLEVERLDVSVTGHNGGLELLGMGHASPELSQSCGLCGNDVCACSDLYGDGASCVDSECNCSECNG